jgi:hypothetical protein
MAKRKSTGTKKAATRKKTTSVKKSAPKKAASKTKKAAPKKVAPKKQPDTIKTLLDSGLLKDFVEKNQGSWDHGLWLELCEEIKEKGHTPIDFDMVGLHLEEHKTAYFSGRSD